MDEFRLCDDVLVDVARRLEQGVPVHREMTAEQIRPVILAAVRWRAIALKNADDEYQAGLESMSLGDVPEKYQKQAQ